MTYALSFSNDFLVGDGSELQPSPRPTSVLQAILSLSGQERIELARDLFGVSPDHLTAEAVLARVIDTNTVENLDSPVCVWIDETGLHTLLVHDHERESAVRFDPQSLPFMPGLSAH